MNLIAPQIYTLDGFTKKNILGSGDKQMLDAKKALDVGCGSRKLPGAVGVDIIKTAATDVVHDLVQFPWPFTDNEFDIVFMNHSLEHLRDIPKTMSEVHRVARAGARVVIQVPYFRSVDAYADLTHRHFFTAGSLDYFILGAEHADYHYTKERFKKCGFWYGWPHHSKNPFRELIKVFAHRFSRPYDQYLSLFFPVSCLTWELEVTKE